MLPQSHSTFYNILKFLISNFKSKLFKNSLLRATFSKSKRDKIKFFNKKEQKHAFILLQVFHTRIQSKAKLEIKAISFFILIYSLYNQPNISHNLILYLDFYSWYLSFLFLVKCKREVQK